MDTQTAPRLATLSDRATAALVGVLYLTGTAAGVGSLVVTNGGHDGPDHMMSAASIGVRLPVGALLVLAMGLVLALIPIVAFPVLRRTSERLALGYLVFRGALETTGYILIAVTWLVLYHLTRSDDAAGAESGGLRVAGSVLVDTGEAMGTLVTMTFLIGAAMFYAVLYRSRLVPRWLSGWGLVAIAPYLAVGVLKMFGVVDTLSVTESVLSAPLAIQELVLAVWLITRGFR